MDLAAGIFAPGNLLFFPLFSSLVHLSSPIPADDVRFMRLALREASKGVGRTSPNPAVGAVIVRAGRVLSRGYHHAAGQPHAEIEALRALKNSELAQGATIYVTLEPCSTHGRTPPCTDAILGAGLARVVIGATDPNPHHAGRAKALLEARGVSVSEGVLDEECRWLNPGFNRWIVSGLPWVIAKAAITLDGRLSRPPGEGQWLSGPEARAHAHQQRARVDAILIGAGTLRADNPRLTVRGVATGEILPKQPWRVVLTRSGNLPVDAHLFTDEWKDRTLVFRDQSLLETLRDLGRRQVTSVLIEGGKAVLAQAFAAGLVNEVQFYLTPLLSGGDSEAMSIDGLARPIVPSLRFPSYTKFGPDVFLSGELALPHDDP